MTSSRFWGVYWDRRRKKWKVQYRDADGKYRNCGRFDDEEEAARALNKAIVDAGLEGKRQMNAFDATGALVPRVRHTSKSRDRSAVVAPDPARASTATSSKFWGVTWSKRARRWKAYYKDANGKKRQIGLFDTQEEAAHAYNAAIRRAGLEGSRKTNPVVDGQLVPRERNAPGQGRRHKRSRDEIAADAPSPPRACRPRRAVNHDEDPDFEPRAVEPPPTSVRRRSPRWAVSRSVPDTGVPTCPVCLDPTTTTLACGHAMCEDCMGRLAASEGQTLTRSRRRVVIRCPLRCDALTERVLA